MTFTGRTGTALLVAVIVSLCLNLLLGGLLIGGRWHGDHGRWRSGESFLMRVPEDARPIVKSVFDAHKADFDARRKEVEDARLKVAELMKADVIDRPQLDLALAELQQRTQTMQQFGHQVMVEVAEKLPPELRREMADRWAKNRFRKKSESE
jgi:hypothetical protein